MSFPGARWRLGGVLAVGSVAIGCAAPPGPATPAPAAPAPGIVTTERGPRGGRLVLVAEDGTRLSDVTPIEPVPVIDVNPTWSPDGRWLVFASNRERRDAEGTSLWLVEHRPGARPVRLTEGRTIDRDPRFLPDGRGIVYGSLAGESLDLWLLPVDLARGAAAGPPRRLTETPDLDELSPSPWPDGSGVVYMGLERDSQRSSLYALALEAGRPDGPARRLTEGPFDATPTVSPDGRTIAFAAPVKGRGDTDLFAIDADGDNRRVLVDDPLGDETGPAWSSDGRWLFATSVIRSMEDGKPLLAVLVCADLRERPVLLRALHDPAGVTARLGAAVGPRVLDAAALHRNATHRAQWERILRQELDRQAREAPGGGGRR